LSLEIIGLIILPITLAILAFIPFLLSRKKESLKEKTENFIKLHEHHKNNSIFYENIAYDFYKIKYNGHLFGEYLLYKQCWVHQPQTQLLKLNDVKINYHQFVNKEKNFEILFKSFNKAIFPNYKENFKFNATKYLEAKYHPHPTFAMKDFYMDDKKAILDVYLGDYFDFLNTCMLFQYETVYEFMNKDKMEPSKDSLRNKYDLLDTANRFVSIGISSLTIFKNS